MKLLVPKICEGAGVEHIQPKIAHHVHPCPSGHGEVTDVACGNGCDALFLYNAQHGKKLIFIPVPPYTGQNGAPLGVGLGERAHLGQDLHRGIDPGGLQGQKLVGDLVRPHDGNGELRHFGGAVNIRQGGRVHPAAGWRCDARLSQGLQGIPAEGIDGAGWEGQSILHLRLDA